MSPKNEAMRLTKFWQTFGPNVYPLDLEKLIEGVIQTSDFADNLNIIERKFDGLEGALIRTKCQRHWTILLNTEIKNSRRRRFTLAHELGHFMCHRDQKDNFEDSDASLENFNDHLEFEANTFASWLLLPANLIRCEFGQGIWNVKRLRDLGSRFECSLQASALRYVALSSRPIAFVVSRDGVINWCCKSKSAPFMSRYKFGDELPPKSLAAFHHLYEDESEEVGGSGFAWSEISEATESQYLDRSGLGYQYTCIEFE